ncbi:MAG: hypothetical protein HOC77_08470 [Chloroflexi bacterium]|nr:hypothetical protein [Chloroflexota bacterium]MBT4073123.1 hypothetical protein [Chloroflexota bacterium]MBT4515105.1 hypothetical protein [Chloroflexota bacterium]MBT6682824.1 hypothetical protein [Chloroflexota bacterium]
MFSPLVGPWAAVGDMARARYLHSAVVCDNGNVVVAGGHADDSTCVATAENFDRGTHGWTQAGRMSQARTWHTVSLLKDGRVLAAGGYAELLGGGQFLDSVEILDLVA